MITSLHQVVNKVYGIFRTNIVSIKIKIQPIHGPCLVLGSAPNPNIPVGFDKTWVLMTANASQTSVKNWNVQPNFTVMSGQMFGASPANIAGQESIRGHKTGRLILVERGHSAPEVKKILQILNYRYDELIVINHWNRSRIAHKVLGEYVAIGSDEGKISTGVFTALMAYFLGADPVVLSGFSFSVNGHAYNTFKHKRSHINIDQAALLLAREKGLPFYAADSKFSLESGLPEWKG